MTVEIVVVVELKKKEREREKGPFLGIKKGKRKEKKGQPATHNKLFPQNDYHPSFICLTPLPRSSSIETLCLVSFSAHSIFFHSC